MIKRICWMGLLAAAVGAVSGAPQAGMDCAALARRRLDTLKTRLAHNPQTTTRRTASTNRCSGDYGVYDSDGTFLQLRLSLQLFEFDNGDVKMYDEQGRVSICADGRVWIEGRGTDCSTF